MLILKVSSFTPPTSPPLFPFPLVCVCMRGEKGRRGGGGIFKDGEERIGKEKVVLGKIRCHGKKKRVNKNLSFFFS